MTRPKIDEPSPGSYEHLSFFKVFTFRRKVHNMYYINVLSTFRYPPRLFWMLKLVEGIYIKQGKNSKVWRKLKRIVNRVRLRTWATKGKESAKLR